MHRLKDMCLDMRNFKVNRGDEGRIHFFIHELLKFIALKKLLLERFWVTSNVWFMTGYFLLLLSRL